MFPRMVPLRGRSAELVDTVDQMCNGHITVLVLAQLDTIAQLGQPRVGQVAANALPVAMDQEDLGHRLAQAV